jgi:hypothetical protein
MLLKDNEDLIDLGQFDPINQLIPLSVISLSVAHCINFLKGFVLIESDFFFSSLLQFFILLPSAFVGGLLLFGQDLNAISIPFVINFIQVKPVLTATSE